MKAMALTGLRQMKLQETPTPRIARDTDVLVKIGVVGVCGSDVHYYVRGHIGPSQMEYPFIVGHEGAGTVEDVGAGVSIVKPGDRVAIEPAMYCGKCDQCLSGRPNTCRQIKFMSCPRELPGCLCEYVVIPEHNCIPVPGNLSLEQAAVAEPLSIAVYAATQAEPLLGASIAILGAGPIGLSVLLAARSKGAGKVHVTDRRAARLAAAKHAGADWTGNPDNENIVESIIQRDPLQPQIVFECCGKPEALNQGIDLLRPGGKLVILGIPEEMTVSLDIHKLRRKEITVVNVRRQRHCMQPALALLANGQVDIGFMVTHRFPLEQAGIAFDLVADYADGVIKALVVMDSNVGDRTGRKPV